MHKLNLLNLKMDDILISIVIVNYNTKDLLYNCVKSIIDSIKAINYEIIIVDNKSSDNSALCCEKYKSKSNINIVYLDDNLGFSKANNIGVERSKGIILHFLNPDTEVSSSLDDDYKTIITNYQNNEDFVYVNPLQNPEEDPAYGKNWIPTVDNYLNYRFNRAKTKYYYIGATVIISRKNFVLIGKWNESFFMYIEDAELFYKIDKYRIPIIEMPSIIGHLGGGASKNVFSQLQREILIQKSFAIFYKENRSLIEYFFMQILILLTFWNKPKRLLFQVKAVFYSFRFNKLS